MRCFGYARQGRAWTPMPESDPLLPFALAQSRA
jgi:hypothetical protein